MNRNKLLNLFARNARKGEYRAEGNVIYVYDVIVASDTDAEFWGGVSAESFVKTLKGLTGDVELRINSPGGDVFGGKAMAQAVRDHGGKVTAHVDGYAASAATLLTAVADETIMAPGSLMMIHKAWSIALGNSEDFNQMADLLEKIDGTLADTYAAAAKRRGVEDQDFAAMMAAETWFTPPEAIAAGLADAEAKDKAAAPKNNAEWDLSAYDNSPKPAETIGAPVIAPAAAIEAAVTAKLATLPAGAETPAHQIEEPARPNLRADMLLRPAA